MKTNYLLPHKFKTLGWVLFILGIISGVIVVTNQYDSNALTIIVLSIYNEGSIFNKNEGFFKIVENSVLDEIIAIAIIVGGLIVGFTKEKVEDEFIYKLRKDSLVWP